MLRNNSVAPQYNNSAIEKSCVYANIRWPKSTYLRDCWILRDKSQSNSICKYKENSHLIPKEELRNHLISNHDLMLKAYFYDVWDECTGSLYSAWIG